MSRVRFYYWDRELPEPIIMHPLIARTGLLFDLRLYLSDLSITSLLRFIRNFSAEGQVMVGCVLFYAAARGHLR